MEKIDKNHDFRLNFDEFVLLYEEVQRRVNCLRFARVKFKELDVNQSGTLDGDELLAVVDIMLELEAVAVEDKVITNEPYPNSTLELIVSRLPLIHPLKHFINTPSQHTLSPHFMSTP